MPNLKVSVIIPYFNAEKTLERAVLSMLEQSFRNFELILVNNNSSDKSEEIAQKLAQTDSRIVLLNEPKQGVTFAANTGNSAAQEQYIARMDADDYSLPERLEKQVDFLNHHPNIGVVSCLVKHVSHRENTRGLETFVKWVNTIQTPEQIELNRFIETPIINPSVMFRKSLIEKHGEYLHGDFPEDYELWLRWLGNGVKMEKIPEVLFHWYDSDTRLTRADKRYSTDAFYQTKTLHLAKWLQQQGHYYVWIWGAGRVSRKRALLIMEQGIFVEGFIDVKAREFSDGCCIAYHQFNWHIPTFILSYVANRGAREKIRRFMLEKGKKEGLDFLLVS